MQLLWKSPRRISSHERFQSPGVGSWKRRGGREGESRRGKILHWLWERNWHRKWSHMAQIYFVRDFPFKSHYIHSLEQHLAQPTFVFGSGIQWNQSSSLQKEVMDLFCCGRETKDQSCIPKESCLAFLSTSLLARADERTGNRCECREITWWGLSTTNIFFKKTWNNVKSTMSKARELIILIHHVKRLCYLQENWQKSIAM